MSPIRYFKNHLAVWKFEHGQQPQIKTPIQRDWSESTFHSLEEFLADLDDVAEITEAQAHASFPAPARDPVMMT
jgi:hypothetical protein